MAGDNFENDAELTMIFVNHHDFCHFNDDDAAAATGDDDDDVDDDDHRKSKERPPLLLWQESKIFCPVWSFQDEVAHSIDLPGGYYCCYVGSLMMDMPDWYCDDGWFYIGIVQYMQSEEAKSKEGREENF